MVIIASNIGSNQWQLGLQCSPASIGILNAYSGAKGMHLIRPWPRNPACAEKSKYGLGKNKLWVTAILISENKDPSNHFIKYSFPSLLNFIWRIPTFHLSVCVLLRGGLSWGMQGCPQDFDRPYSKYTFDAPMDRKVTKCWCSRGP